MKRISLILLLVFIFYANNLVLAQDMEELPGENLLSADSSPEESPDNPPVLIQVEKSQTITESGELINITQYIYLKKEPAGDREEAQPVNLTVQLDGQMSSLPDPDSGKVYNLQVGAFAQPANARVASQRLRNAGFEALEEQYGSLCRVSAAGIAARDLSFALEQLAKAGFNDIWVRE